MKVFGSTIQVLPDGSPAELRSDILAGLTAAAGVLPKAMAYATVAGFAGGGRSLYRLRSRDYLWVVGLVTCAQREFDDDAGHPDGGRTR